MKRVLLLLSLAFLVLWIAALFYPTRNGSIHIALIVGLLFFFRSLMVTDTPIAKETSSRKSQE